LGTCSITSILIPFGKVILCIGRNLKLFAAAADKEDDDEEEEEQFLSKQNRNAEGFQKYGER
jgi:hypothetical protein